MILRIIAYILRKLLISPLEYFCTIMENIALFPQYKDKFFLVSLLTYIIFINAYLFSLIKISQLNIILITELLISNLIGILFYGFLYIWISKDNYKIYNLYTYGEETKESELENAIEGIVNEEIVEDEVEKITEEEHQTKGVDVGINEIVNKEEVKGEVDMIDRRYGKNNRVTKPTPPVTLTVAEILENSGKDANFLGNKNKHLEDEEKAKAKREEEIMKERYKIYLERKKLGLVEKDSLDERTLNSLINNDFVDDLIVSTADLAIPEDIDFDITPEMVEDLNKELYSVTPMQTKSDLQESKDLSEYYEKANERKRRSAQRLKNKVMSKEIQALIKPRN